MQLKELKEICEANKEDRDARIHPSIVLQLIERNEKLSYAIEWMTQATATLHDHGRCQECGEKALSLYGSEVPLK